MVGLYRYIIIGFFLLIAFVITGRQVVYGQHQSAQRPDEVYLERSGSPREYIDGRDYYPYYSGLRTSPVLRSDEEQSALLVIHGRTYNNLVLQYDTFTDDVVYTDDSLFYEKRKRHVALNKYKVNRFDLCFRDDTLHFRYLSNAGDTTFNLSEGYYEVVHDMKTKFLIKHASAEVIHSSPDDIYDLREYFYEPVNYVKISGDFQRISSRKKFVNLFGNRSPDISRFLRQHAIRMKIADKEQIKEVLEYYEQLN
jgi:hypothetical protein